jgi:hypothetical protein
MRMNFRERRKAEVQLRRILLPRRWVNKALPRSNALPTGEHLKADPRRDERDFVTAYFRESGLGECRPKRMNGRFAPVQTDQDLRRGRLSTAGYYRKEARAGEVSLAVPARKWWGGEKGVRPRYVVASYTLSTVSAGVSVEEASSSWAGAQSEGGRGPNAAQNLEEPPAPALLCAIQIHTHHRASPVSQAMSCNRRVSAGPL